MMHKVILKEDYFSDAFKWVGAGVCISIGIILVWYSYYWVIAPVLLLIGSFFTTYNEIEIDLTKGVAKDTFLFLLIPVQEETKRFNSLTKIRLDKQRHSYTANSRARTAQVKFAEYIGTLELDSGDLELLREVDYEKFSERIKKVSSELNLPIERTF